MLFIFFCLLYFVYPCFLLQAQPFHKEIIAAQLDSIYTGDQKLRERLVYIDQHWQDDLQSVYDSLWSVQNIRDSINMIAVDHLVIRYGWDTLMALDTNSRATVFLVIQHSDSSHQAKYLPLIGRAVEMGYMPPRFYALLKDRITLLQCKKQYYGTQYYWDDKLKKYVLFSIVGGIGAAEKRRAAFGMVSLETYLDYVNRR